MDLDLARLADISGDESAGDLWVFGYGSLMWQPGFPFTEQHTAVVSGWRRRLCIVSHVYRGTPEIPGLVLGLDQGGECVGVAFRVEARRRAHTLSYLRERELVSYVYDEKIVRAKLASGDEVDALTYVADTRHGQYSGDLPRSELLAIVRRASGISGANSDYVINTHEHLRSLHIDDVELTWLADQLRSA